jgi:hypothetical protein
MFVAHLFLGGECGHPDSRDSIAGASNECTSFMVVQGDSGLMHLDSYGGTDLIDLYF